MKKKKPLWFSYNPRRKFILALFKDMGKNVDFYFNWDQYILSILLNTDSNEFSANDFCDSQNIIKTCPKNPH